MQRTLILLGIIIILIGLAWPWLGKVPLGRLPGDLVFGDRVRVYIPITTMLLVSALLSLILWLLRK